MNSLMSRQHASLPRYWPQKDKTIPHKGLLVAGAVVVGLGLLSWIYLGPDLKRYLKIHSM